MKIDNLEDIENLIVQAENEQIEFKETTGQLERGISLMTEESQKANRPEPNLSCLTVPWCLFSDIGKITVQAPHKHHLSTTQVQALVNRTEYKWKALKKNM